MLCFGCMTSRRLRKRIIMAKKLTINKRILRCEYAEIVPEAYVPEWETLFRFDPGPLVETLHAYVVDYIAERIPSQSIKKMSVHRVLLTKALLKEVHKRPQWQKDIVFELEDAERVLDILDSCIGAAARTIDPNLGSKQIDRIWNMIKCAYGGAYAPPNQAIFDSFVKVYVE